MLINLLVLKKLELEVYLYNINMPKKKSITSLAQQSVGIRLSSHEKLCAERMNNLITSIQRLEKKVADLSDNVSKGKGMISVLVALGTIAAACIGYFNFK